VITRDPNEFLATFAALPAARPATPKGVFLIAPDAFGIEEESARDNRYMAKDAIVDRERAHAQHRALAAAIEAVGVDALVLRGAAGQCDGVFLNNVFATASGRFVIGSMRHPARRAEAGRADVRAIFERDMGREVVDLSRLECVAELTGPLVIDRARGVGFCGRTERVDDPGIAAMHAAFDLALTYVFDLRESEYHTNVVLSVLASRAVVICESAFADPAAARAIAAAYAPNVVAIDAAEKDAYAGNCLALTERDVFLSATASRALRSATRARFAELGFALHAVEADEFEKAGGSVRCLISELW
jgi:N-dimethylarginine dimethylaminohydrolase